MTPYELSVAISSFNERKKRDLEEELFVTYFGAYWQRVDKLSMDNLKELIKKINDEQPEQKKKMTPEEMLHEVKKLNAAFGGTTY